MILALPSDLVPCLQTPQLKAKGLLEVGWSDVAGIGDLFIEQERTQRVLGLELGYGPYKPEGILKGQKLRVQVEGKAA